MRADLLQDVIQRSLGRAAAMIGDWCDVYRPTAAADPISAGNRLLRLQAAFSPPDGVFSRPVGYGQSTWIGVYDAAYTQPGDYLVRSFPGEIWFVAAQQKLLGALCIQAARIVSFSRPATAGDPGLNGYGGVTRSAATPLLTRWPAGVLNAGGGAPDPAGLPAGAAPGSWQVLLPAFSGTVLRNGDLMSDDLGRAGIVASAELTDLGWRLLVRQAAS